MKNITFSADEALISKARALARMRNTTLNEEFRVWLGQYATQKGQDVKMAEMMALIDQLTAPGAREDAPQDIRAGRGMREAVSERERRMLSRLDGTPFE